jgi:hypothetical protein
MSEPPRKQDPPSAAATARARYKEQRRGRARERAGFVRSREGECDQRALDAAMARLLTSDADRDVDAGGSCPSMEDGVRRLRAFPVSDVLRWVPIGPSVVRRGQAEGRPRVTGRVRDLAVSADGSRAYAATAKGGVWYTGDAGSTWAPVGGWADRAARAGGSNNAQACGCLLVSFGATAVLDFVMVGTGELVPGLSATGELPFGGIGVLAGRSPAAIALGANPWESDAGTAQLEGLGVFRLARHPASLAGKPNGADVDRVVAATSSGLFLGVRSTLVAAPPARDGFTWAKRAALDVFVGAVPRVTDVVWLPGGANGRIVVAIDSKGVAFSDDLGVSWRGVTGLDPKTPPLPVGRISLANPTGTRLYALGERPGSVPTLWQIPVASAAVPAAAIVVGVPPALWGGQRDYDQAIAVDVVGAVDRVYLGGSTVQAAAGGNWSASLWCFDTPVPAAPLVPSPQVSTVGAPPAGAGADQPGLIGNNVHADVHVVRLAGAAGANRQVWVGCDGGVFISAQAGRCNTFLSRSTGLAALEVGFHAAHPTSSHFVAIGCQDNGTQVRVGDTVWEVMLQGDGGGVAFHPIASQFLVAQYIQGTWLARPTAGYVDPLHRATGGVYEPPIGADREYSLSAFYSGPSSVALSPTAGRIAIGTNRVWLSDDLGIAPASSWGVLPSAAAGPAVDARPGGTDLVPQQGIGVPAAGLGAVIQLRWVDARHLLALYAGGVVRYTQAVATGVWTPTTLIPGTPGAPNPLTTVLTDIFPVDKTQNFYLTCTGDTALVPADTCLFFDSALPAFTPTNLRHVLDVGAVVGPLDPAYAVVVDPTASTEVYVGTVTGVWHGTRTPGVAAHAWVPLVNGLPQAAVQDLAFWIDPAAGAGSPRLLRAAVQSRGVWEVNLAGDEPRRTYVRVHAQDDRRIFPTPMSNPRRGPAAPPEPTFASPDMVVRPAARAPLAPAPGWLLPIGATINSANVPAYHLWTFQTAFRWVYPSIIADGQWSDQLADLIELHRTALLLPPGAFIDAALWAAVVGATRLAANGAVSALPADPLAVYRAPWQSASAPGAVATEVDVIELVQPARVVADVWQVFAERSTVDVLLHHRDTRPLPRNDAFALLLWRSAATAAPLLASDPAPLPAYARSLLTALPAPLPAGWNLASPAVGSLHRLDVELDARLPRAISIDVDLSAVTPGHRVLFVAIVGSSLDPLATAVVGAPASMGAFTRAWPNAALRLVRVVVRP